MSILFLFLLFILIIIISLESVIRRIMKGTHKLAVPLYFVTFYHRYRDFDSLKLPVKYSNAMTKKICIGKWRQLQFT